jgi:hypothetical protein
MLGKALLSLVMASWSLGSDLGSKGEVPCQQDLPYT